MNILVTFHQISLSLPFKPLKIHTYIFRSDNDPEKLLLLDTGVNRKETITELNAGIQKIDNKLSIESIEWIIPSHAHIDHSGRIPQLVKEGFSGTWQAAR